MRLTLRNMLAYLDGILEPQDALDLSKKIEESKFASDLMHRIRDLMRRLRLAAPSVSERGPGLDPNTVAEYLDNTLPSDRVTDFEKVCLEANTTMADIHLAEVAACHQILTLVLGEPAEIDPATRERIYQLPSTAIQPEPVPQVRTVHLPPPIPATPAEPSQIPQELLEFKTRSKPTVPEYLREPRKKRPWFAITAGLLAAACLLLIVINVSHPARNFFAKFGLVSPIPEVASNENGAKESSKITGNNEEGKTPAAESKTTQEPAVSENPKTATSESDANKSDETPGKETPQTPGGEPPSIPPQPQNPPGGPLNEATNPANPELTTIPPPPPVSPIDNTQSGTADKAIPGNETVANNEQATAPTAPTNTGSTTVAPGTVVNKDVPEIIQKPMGRFTSLDQILLRSNGDSGNWERAKGDSILFPQQHLIAFPTYRPAITLSSGLILQMLGGTEVALLPGDQQSPSGIKIRYGRVVINSVANPGIRLRLVIGDQAGILTFLDAETNVGIEVHRAHVPGTNPEEEASRIMTEIFVTKDRITWEDGSRKPIEIIAPARILMLPQIPPVTDHPKDFPEWIKNAEAIQGIDRRASQVMLQSFTPETPAQQKLLELSDPQTRLIEVRRLAIRCLGYLGYFEPMVAALNDPASKGEWQDYYVKWLREAVERDPQTAAAVREALEKNYSPQAADLYRMLWGYTDKDLIAGEDAKLVKNLDDDNLAVRVLAIANLKYITDKDLGFNPIGTLPQRARIVQLWERRLEGKEIRNKQADKKNGPAIPEPPAPPPAIDENRT